MGWPFAQPRGCTEMDQVVTFVHVKPVKSRKKILYVGMLGRGSVIGLAFLLTNNFCHSLASNIGDGKTDRLIDGDNFSFLPIDQIPCRLSFPAIHKDGKVGIFE